MQLNTYSNKNEVWSYNSSRNKKKEIRPNTGENAGLMR